MEIHTEFGRATNYLREPKFAAQAVTTLSLRIFVHQTHASEVVSVALLRRTELKARMVL